MLGDLVARGTRSSVHAYGRGAVVKVPYPSTPEHWIESEAMYADAARAVGAPAPRLLGIERVEGRAASVWERVGGESMWRRVIDNPEDHAEHGRLLADVQCGLLALAPPATLPSQRDRIVSKIRLTAATVDPMLAPALDLLPPRTPETHLCHGDLHPSNIILGPRGPVIVDWFDAARGEAIADVARTCLLLLADGAGGPRHLPGSDRPTLAGLTDAYLSCLRRKLEIGGELLARWEAIQAVARMAEGLPLDGLLEIWRRFEAGPQPTAYAATN